MSETFRIPLSILLIFISMDLVGSPVSDRYVTDKINTALKYFIYDQERACDSIRSLIAEIEYDEKWEDWFPYFGLGLLSFFLIGRSKYLQDFAKQEVQLEKEKNRNLMQQQKLLAMDYIVQGQEEERKRIAKDLHDGFGGLLATAKHQLKSIEKEIEKLDDLKLFQHAESLLADAHEEVRRISHDMMPEALMKLGLQSAIEDLAMNVNMGNDIQVITQLYIPDKILSEQKELIIYRIIQECIQNTVKHANAKKLIIQLTETDEDIHLTIEDDGIGFDLSEKKLKQTMGLKSLESRTKYLNGKIDIESSAGAGTSIDILIPK